MQMPGEKLVEKMWDSLVDKGIGSLLKPWQTRRDGRAETTNRAEEMLLLAQAERDASDVRAGKKKVHREGKRVLLLEQNAEVVDGRAEPQLDIASVMGAASQARAAQAVLDEVNVAKSILHAESLLHDDTQEPNDKPLNSDWLRNWRDGAARVSSDELQSLWGKILAGEVKTPGACSLRTLDFIKNLSVDEARQIEKVCPFVVDRLHIFKYGVIGVKERGLDYGYFMFLEELGLVNTGGMNLSYSWPSISPDKFNRGLFVEDRVIVVSGDDASRQLVLNTIRVTPLGAQVFSLNQVPVDSDYWIKIAEACAAQGFDVEVGKYVDIGNGRVQVVGGVKVGSGGN
ncbi:DUF2806 domain-containing protein [Burkholderia cepacia]|uniref:DUF2806 domain-containing protein n=1 Tax=Burkholderia cepacia TaxID=292 RepID=UPI000A6B7642|nr:DUF2806 domain-containing protein [Burkholderia cepacia]MCA7990414.1 DUF2806 domain-containing protein [Burkholderia cepacia]